jgi:hypothetical protein
MDTAEVIRLVMALAVAPGYAAISRRLHPISGKRCFDVAVYAILASYIFNVLEDLVMKDVMVTLLLLSFGVAGVASCLGALAMWRTARSERGQA